MLNERNFYCEKRLRMKSSGSLAPLCRHTKKKGRNVDYNDMKYVGKNSCRHFAA